MSPLSLYFGILLLVAGGLARSDEHDSGERSYHVPDLAHDGVKHDFSSSVEDSLEDAPKPKMKRSLYFEWSDENIADVSQEAKTIVTHTISDAEIPTFVWHSWFGVHEDTSAEVQTEVSTKSDENHFGNDVNEVTFESHEEKLQDTTSSPPETSNIEAFYGHFRFSDPQVVEPETPEVTSLPAHDSEPWIDHWRVFAEALNQDLAEITQGAPQWLQTLEPKTPEVTSPPAELYPEPWKSAEALDLQESAGISSVQGSPYLREQSEVTPSPTLDVDDLSIIYQALRPMFEPQVPQHEPADVVIMVNDVKIQVSRQQKQPALPIPYYYMASRS